jgi:hypothetical protein
VREPNAAQRVLQRPYGGHSHTEVRT